jgi:hypothetical protein
MNLPSIAQYKEERAKKEAITYLELQRRDRRLALELARLDPAIADRMAGDSEVPTYMGFYHCRHFFVYPAEGGLLYVAFWIDILGKQSDEGLFVGSAPAEAVFKAVEAVRNPSEEMAAETSRLHQFWAMAF